MSFFSKPLYFLHIPKTAGTSLRDWLCDFFPASEVLECFVLEDLEKIPLEQLVQYRFFSGHFGFELPKLLPTPPNTFTWLRDPIALQISHYNFFRHDQETYLQFFSAKARAQASEFLDNVSKLSVAEICKLYQGFTDNPQVRYLAGVLPRYASEGRKCNEEMLEIAKQNLLNLMHFGLCEWMQPSIELLCYQAKLAPRKFNRYLNRSSVSVKAVVSELSDHDLAIIHEINKYDQELYCFAKLEFKRRYQDMWEQCLQSKTGYLQPSFASAGTLSDLDPLDPEAAEARAVMACFLEDQFRRRPDHRTERTFFKFSEATFDSGWYGRQYYEPMQTWLRWAGPETSSCIYLPLKAGVNYRLSFWILLCPHADIQNSLRVEVEGIEVGLEQLYLQDDSSKTRSLIVATVPSDLVREDVTYTKVVFKVNRVTRLGPEDKNGRQVSFAIDGVSVESDTTPSLAGAVLKLKSNFQTLQQQTSQLEYFYNESQEQVQAAQAENQQLQEQLTAAQHYNQQLQEDFRHAKTQTRQLRQTLAEAREATQQLQNLLTQTQASLSNTQAELQQVQNHLTNIKQHRDLLTQELEQTQHRLQDAGARIAAMETSKFWQLRRAWFKIKRSFGLRHDE